MINTIFKPIFQWWSDRQDRAQLEIYHKDFQSFLKKTIQQPTDATQVESLKCKTVELLDKSKGNSALKKEVAALERVYLTFLRETNQVLPTNYSCKENLDLCSTFSKLGISQNFLRQNPDFLDIARKYFWQHCLPFVQTPCIMDDSGELFLPVETGENSGVYTMRPWSEIKGFNLDEYRLTYRGFAVGHSDSWKNMVSLKTVKSDGKCVLQFITACPANRSLPSSLDFKASGHSFTQIIVPKNGDEAEVYSIGFYPRKLADLGLRFFKTVPGVYRNADSNVSRILAGQVVPIVKQYEFRQDSLNDPCLYAIVTHMDAIVQALASQGKTFTPITLDQIQKAMYERNEPELDRILIELTEIRTQIVKGTLPVAISPMTPIQKARVVMQRFEDAQGKHPYNVIGANCTAVSYREESFAAVFLDAQLDGTKSVKVFDNQIDLKDHRVGIFDRIRDVIERIFLHFFVALPLTGPLCGTGSCHPDAEDLQPRPLIPLLSETANATYQMLIAAFQEKPVFPAGEITAANVPVIQPLSLWQRIRYLWNRHQLLHTANS